jgi:hypothetical protein
MFISKKRLERLEERIAELERGQIYFCNVKATDPRMNMQKTVRINDIISCILNHFNLKLEGTPAKVELVPKDDK